MSSSGVSGGQILGKAAEGEMKNASKKTHDNDGSVAVFKLFAGSV